MRFNLAFSSSSIFRRLSSVRPRPPNFLFQVQYVASDAPIWRQPSTTGVPDSASRGVAESRSLHCFSFAPIGAAGKQPYLPF